jgi:hypothetical protein
MVTAIPTARQVLPVPADANDQIVVAHGVDVASLPVRSRPHVPAAFHRRQRLRALQLLPALHHRKNGAHIFLSQFAVRLEHGPKLLKDAVGLIDLLLVAFDVDKIAARDQTHAERIADQPQILIAAAEEHDRFVAVIESQGDGGFRCHWVLQAGPSRPHASLRACGINLTKKQNP